MNARHPDDPPAVVLDPLRVEDAEEMAVVLADPTLHDHTGGTPPTADELRARYAAQLRGPADGGTRWLNRVIRVDGAAAGYVQATVDRRTATAEVAWVVGVAWQGRGVATAAARLLVAELTEDGVTRLLAHVHPGHLASQGVARTLGLHPTDRTLDGEVEWVSG